MPTTLKNLGNPIGQPHRRGASGSFVYTMHIAGKILLYIILAQQEKLGFYAVKRRLKEG
jgi:hypothetical protein